MKDLRRRVGVGDQDTKNLPLISPKIILSAAEVSKGCTVVNVPLTSLDRERLDNGMNRTGKDVGHAVRDALRLADITSEEECVLGNQFLTRDSVTREIRARELWPKKCN